MSPVLEDGQMELISFDKFYYDVTDHRMKAMDPKREEDFISISGSKMRALARQGATPCPDPIPNDLLAANCVPQVSLTSMVVLNKSMQQVWFSLNLPVFFFFFFFFFFSFEQGFMVQTGWEIVCDYYQNIDTKRWVPWSKSIVEPTVAANTKAIGMYGTTDFELLFTEEGGYGTTTRFLSPWHDLPLLMSSGGGYGSDPLYTFVVEIPMYETAKMEVSKADVYNPIKQDTNKDGSPRYYTYGTPFFNYGLLPQTWEDPSACDAKGHCGDNDPLDVMEIGSTPLPMGTVTPVRVLGSLELIDEGETDHKIIAIRTDDPDYNRITDMASLEAVKPGIVEKLIDWLKMYKTSDGKGVNSLSSDLPTSKAEAISIISECNARWQKLKSGMSVNRDRFYISP